MELTSQLLLLTVLSTIAIAGIFAQFNPGGPLIPAITPCCQLNCTNDTICQQGRVVCPRVPPCSSGRICPRPSCYADKSKCISSAQSTTSGGQINPGGPLIPAVVPCSQLNCTNGTVCIQGSVICPPQIPCLGINCPRLPPCYPRPSQCVSPGQKNRTSCSDDTGRYSELEHWLFNMGMQGNHKQLLP
nr:unnamed protein product [Haemonchus contortus]